MYKLLKDIILNRVTSIHRLSDNAYIPFNPANNDYTDFKNKILVDEAQLQDADGNVMSAEQAKEYVEELP